MRKFLVVITIVLSTLPAFAQAGIDSDSLDAPDADRTRVRPKIKPDVGEMMATISGIGLDKYNPPLNNAATAKGMWTNVNLMLYCLEIQAGWGVMEADVSKLDPNRYGGTSVGTPGVPVYGRNWAVGVNLPIAAKRFGINSGRPGALLRGHFFGAFSMGGIGIWDNNRVNKSSFAYVTLAPGFRLYNNIFSAEVRLLGQAGIGIGEYEEYIDKLSITPMFTLRANGMFKRLVYGQRLIGSSSFSVSNVNTSSKTDRITRADGVYDRTTTTTTATVSGSRGNSVLNDIGAYVGIGPRVTFTRPFAEHYAGPTLLYGLGLQGRASKFIFGLNVETGKAGHATITRNRGEEKRKVDEAQTYAKGQLNATNAFLDFGIDISSLAKGLFLHTVDDENNVTTFASLNFGYSVGYSFVGGQTFANDSTATRALNNLKQSRTDWQSTIRTDPRESSSGLVGGFFLGFDIGNVGFRGQWYRYKNAPLANNFCYTLSYRFAAKGKRR